MNTRPVKKTGWHVVAAATLPLCLVASAAFAAPDNSKDVPTGIPVKPSRGGGQGGIAGFGGGGGGCEYALDDGTGDQNIGFGISSFQGSTNALTADAGCPSVNVIRVAWGTITSPGIPVSVALYADPNGDGDPSDVTDADLLAQSFGVTANENSDTFNNYPITETVVPPVFFVVAVTSGSAADFPMRLDNTTDAASSYFIAGISDPADPLGSAGTILQTGGSGFPGNLMVRAAFDIGGDECDDCFNVAEGSYEGSTAHQTGATGDDTSCATGDTVDTWYCYTAGCTGLATASLCDAADFDTTIAVFDACSDGVEIECNDDADGCGGNTSELSWAALFGETYYVRVSGWNGDSGDYTLTLSCEGSLLNDNCEDRLEIFDGLTAFSTLEATTDGPAHADCQYDGQTYNDIWFNYTAICDGTLLVTTCADLGGTADYDTDLVVYSGTDCPVTDDRVVGCNDDDGDNPCGQAAPWSSTVQVSVLAGETFKFRVGGWGAGDAGNGLLLVDCQPINDLCEDALPIEDGLTEYDTTGANTDGPENPGGNFCLDNGAEQTDNDIWYDYVASCTGELLVTTCVDLGGFAGYDTDLVVYEGTECPVTNDRLLGCNDDDPNNPCGMAAPWASTVRVPVVAGESYKIRVGGWGAADEGPGELFVRCEAPPILNEIRIDQPGSDNDEYVELKGTAGASLDGVTLVIIGDGSGTGSGTIEEAVDLSGNAFRADGLFLIAEDNDVLGATPNLIVSLNMENSDNVTYVLAEGFFGAVGDDVDPNDDCVIDLQPWTGTLDAVSLVEDPDGGDCFYGKQLGGANVGPDGTFVPAHVYRCVPDGTWFIGAFFPADGTDTPGEENLLCCITSLNLAPATPVNPLGYDPGDEVIIQLSMDSCDLVAGFQAFISFDEAELEFVSGMYTAAPFGQAIIDPITASGGDINLAAGIDQTIGQIPVEGEAVLVLLTFTAQDSFCLPSSLEYRENNPPTRLSDPDGNDLLPLDLRTELAESCKGDTNLDGEVNIDDLMAVIQDYGNDEPCGSDTDGNGVVDVDDLIQVILRWGACP